MLRHLILTFLALLAMPALQAQGNPSILPDTGGFDIYTNEPFSVQLQCFNCPGGITPDWRVLEGEVPGLTLNRNTGVLSGTPTATGTYFLSVAVFPSMSPSAEFFVEQTYQVRVDERLIITTGSGLVIRDSGTYTLPDQLSGGFQLPLTSSLPGNWALLSGSPFELRSSANTTVSALLSANLLSPGTYEVRFSVSSFSNLTYITTTLTPTLRFRVLPFVIANTALPAGQVGVDYFAALETAAGAPPSTYSLNGTLPPGLTLSPEGSIRGTPTQAGAYPFVINARDAAGRTTSSGFSITVAERAFSITSTSVPNAQSGSPYSTNLTTQGGTAPVAFRILGGNLPAGLTLAANGAITGVPTSLGSFSFRVAATDAQAREAQANLTLRVDPSPLRITTALLAEASRNVPYSQSVSAAGGNAPYRFALVQGTLPAGLTFTPTGLLSGTPEAAGSFPITIEVRDTASAGNAFDYAGARAESRFVLTVSDRPAPLTITTTTLPNGRAGTDYSLTLQASGGTPPYNWSLVEGALPAGLSLANTGLLGGQPIQAQATSFQIRVTDADGAAQTRGFTLSIDPAPFSFTATTLPDAEVGTAYLAPLPLSGGVRPFQSVDVVSGALPPGVVLSNAGSVNGTPTTEGTFSFRLRLVDAQGAVAEGPFTLRVNTVPLRILTPSLPTAQAGRDYSQPLEATGGRPPYQWRISQGTLPGGLALNSNIITGRATVSGSYPITVTVSDGTREAAQAYTLVVETPVLPTVSLTQIGDTAAAGTQPNFGINIAQSFPLALDGAATLSFAPENGPADPNIRFANGSSTLNFTIPAGQNFAVPPSGVPFAFQTGTVAGTITLTVVMRQNGVTLNPNPAVTRTIRIARAAPVITSVRAERQGNGLQVIVAGYSNTREITGASFRFTASSGSLDPAPINVAVQPAFQSWFGSGTSVPFGGQFLLTVPFNVQGSAQLSGVEVTLVNSVGSTSASTTF